MMNTDGTVPGNLPNVSKTYCACRATQALNAGSWTWALLRDMRHVAGVPGDRQMPSRRPAHGAEDQHPLQFAERNRLMPGPVDQRAVRDFPASRQAPRTAPEQCFHQREFLEFPQHADTGTSLLNAHLAPS